MAANPIHDASDSRRCFLSSVIRFFSELESAVDAVILLLIVAKEFILDFLGFGQILNVVICVFVVLRLFGRKWHLPYYLVIPAVWIVLACIVSFVFGGSASVAAKNGLRLIQVGVYLAFFAFLIAERRGAFDRWYTGAAPGFNAILIVNMIAMLVQFNVPGALSASTSGAGFVGMSFDSISGFFGYCSTHSVAVFTAFVAVYNFVLAKKMASKVISFALRLLTVVEVAASAYIATLNDNKALFFLLALTLVAYLVLCAARDWKKTLTVAGPCVVAFCMLIFALWQTVPQVSQFIQANVLIPFDISVARAWDLDARAYVNGSDERFNIVHYALSLPTTWIFGEGFAIADMYLPGFHGYNHFGMSDYGSLVILGGLWFYLAVVICYAAALSLPGKIVKRQNVPLLVVLVILFVLASVFTQPFSQVRIAIPLILLGYSFSYMWESDKKGFRGLQRRLDKSSCDAGDNTR